MALAPLRLTIPYDASFQRAPAPLMQSLNEIEWIVAGIGLLAALMFRVDYRDWIGIQNAEKRQARDARGLPVGP